MMGESYESAVWLLRRIPDLPADVIHSDWIDFPTIIGERFWSAGEWCLIVAAQDIWNGTGKCTLAQLLASTDDEHYAAVLHALQQRRPRAFDTNLIGAN